MPQMKKVTIKDERTGESRIALISDDPKPAPKNPPLTALNAAYRAEDDERRDEVTGAVKAASGAMTQALMNRNGRRVQKNLRPAQAKAG